MLGKRLLDVAALFNASRGAAQKHVALRARQVDVYNRTSTLAKAVRHQTDRVTETIKAASFLASRLNESGPVWNPEATDDAPERQPRADTSIPSKESIEGGPVSKPKNGIEQDHFYERSTGNSAAGPAPENDLEVQQEKAVRYPLPDETIPPTVSDLNSSALNHSTLSAIPQDEAVKEPLGNEGLQPASSSTSSIPSPARKPLSAKSARKLQRQSELQIPSMAADALDGAIAEPLEEGYRKSTHTSHALSSLPRVKLPKHTSNAQGVDSHWPASQLNSDSFYDAAPPESIPSVEAVPAQEQVPEGVDTALFYSPRVAKLLGGKIQGFKQGGLELKGVKDTSVDHTNLATNKDQDTFNVRTTSEDDPAMPDDSAGLNTDLSRPSTVSEEVTNFAQNISTDMKTPQVRVRLVALKSKYV
jgi:aarF domain-containing kinase